MDKHLLRLNVEKADQFWCPINKFALAPGYRLEGELPLGVDLRYISTGVASGKLIDVRGTVFKKKAKGESNVNVSIGDGLDQGRNEIKTQDGINAPVHQESEESVSPEHVNPENKPAEQGHEQEEVTAKTAEPAPKVEKTKKVKDKK